MDTFWGFFIAALLFAIGVMLFVAVRKTWISDQTLARLAHVGAVVAAVATLVIVILTLRSFYSDKITYRVVFLPVVESPGLLIEIDGEPIDSLTTQISEGRHELRYSYTIGDTKHEYVDQIIVESDTTIRIEPEEVRYKLVFEPTPAFDGLRIEIDGKSVDGFKAQVSKGSHDLRYFYRSGIGVLHERKAHVLVESDTTIRVLHFR